MQEFRGLFIARVNEGLSGSAESQGRTPLERLAQDHKVYYWFHVFVRMPQKGFREDPSRPLRGIGAMRVNCQQQLEPARGGCRRNSVVPKGHLPGLKETIWSKIGSGC